jgi:riboflavin transporter FmnP
MTPEEFDRWVKSRLQAAKMGLIVGLATAVAAIVMALVTLFVVLPLYRAWIR